MGAQDPGVISGRRTHLTPREIETLSLLTTGRTYQEIAATMGISPKTVETNIANAKVVMGAKTTVHLAVLFVRKFRLPSPTSASGINLRGDL